jgi:uncharacterized SAM-binding protein YcdF (DUF218 family)
LDQNPADIQGEMKFRGKPFFLVAVLLSLLFMVGFHEKILLAVGDFLIIEDELRPAGVIHVIAGEDYRTEHAIQLYQQGYAKYLFFSGGWCKTHGYYHGEHGKELALAQGVPNEAIAYDDTPVTSTYSETVRLKAWMDQSPVPIRSVIVVSDPFHMRRSQWTARRVLGREGEVLMSPVPMERTPYQRHWWEDIQSKRYVKEEYQKFFYYIARYQLSWGRLQEWLASLDTG